MTQHTRQSAQDKAEQDVQDEQEDTYESMVQMANDGIIVIQDETIMMANLAFQRMLGHNDVSLVGRRMSDFLDTATAHQYSEVQEKFDWGERGRPSFRIRFVKKDGSILNVEISTSDFIHKGKPAILGIVRNITHQLELEAAIDASETRYRALYDSSPIAYFSLSLLGNILQVNKAAEHLLGYEDSDLLRRNLSSFLPSTDQEEIVRQVVSEVAQGKSVEDFEMQMKKSDGSSHWVSVTANLLEYPDKSSTIALMALDADRRKNAELREQDERARANLYLEIMTHDQNNINQSLLFSIGLLENSEETPDQFKPLMYQSSWNVRRSGRMIANLRALHRIANDPPMREKVDVNTFLELALEKVRNDFHWKKLELNSNIKDGMFEVAGHQYLEHVCFNILHNALTYDERDSVEIDINAEVVEQIKMIRIEFADRGIGVPDTTKEFIFRRTGSPEDQIVGRGLGLTLVDQILKNIGGIIKVEDRVKGDHTKGAKFIVLLPTWVKVEELHCGKNTCITFYKSNHCVFCEPSMEVLTSVLDSFGVPLSMVEILNVDDPQVEVSEDELPMLPYVKICNEEFSGFISESAIRSAVLTLMMTNCYPDYS
ncbi:MAG: PAS domain S-box protein [Candidatus Thorarchaeota archaeon]|jgi:PAS domain S-box-containing protein